MALLRGAPRLNLQLCGRNLKHPCPPVGARSLSDKVSPKVEPSSAPDIVSDHLLVTPEHFALKESLRKVRKSAANFDFIPGGGTTKQQKSRPLLFICVLEKYTEQICNCGVNKLELLITTRVGGLE